ncbi:MAG: amidohydrolase family protein, partial [Acidobacteriota bacterium]
MIHCHYPHCVFAGVLLAGLLSCAPQSAPPREGVKVFVGARILDGTGNTPIENAVMLVREGRIEAVGARDSIQIPDGAQRIHVSGKTIIPGLINSHGHVGGTKGLESGPEHYSQENVLHQLGLYARYGVTTVLSLGGDQQEAVPLRDAQDTPELDRARLYIAGRVVTAETPEAARQEVDEMAAMKVDFIKIRVDDNLGTRKKMAPEVYQAVIDQAHQNGLRVAAHFFYLEDGKSLLRSGVDFLAHSARDQEVDVEFIELLKEHDVCLCPTLVREVSTFVYEDVPGFFEDPFFLREADPEVLAQLKDPDRQQQVRNSRSAKAYKQALKVASANLKKLVDEGLPVAFGTDSGPPARFQGYFEHMELQLMAKADLTSMQILVSATGAAARCLGLADDLGTLEPGRWADFIVLSEDPLADITNSRNIESVWIAGNRVP